MFRNETLDFWEIQSRLLSISKIQTNAKFEKNAKQKQKLKQLWMTKESHNQINEQWISTYDENHKTNERKNLYV